MMIDLGWDSASALIASTTEINSMTARFISAGAIALLCIVSSAESQSFNAQSKSGSFNPNTRNRKGQAYDE
jgi:hypothetical protein